MAIFWFPDPSLHKMGPWLLHKMLCYHQMGLQERNLDKLPSLFPMTSNLLPLQLPPLLRLWCRIQLLYSPVLFTTAEEGWIHSIFRTFHLLALSTGAQLELTDGFYLVVSLTCGFTHQEQRLLSCPKMSLWAIPSCFNADSASQTWQMRNLWQVSDRWEARACLLCFGS